MVSHTDSILIPHNQKIGSAQMMLSYFLLEMCSRSYLNCSSSDWPIKWMSWWSRYNYTSTDLHLWIWVHQSLPTFLDQSLEMNDWFRTHEVVWMSSSPRLANIVIVSDSAESGEVSVLWKCQVYVPSKCTMFQKYHAPSQSPWVMVAVQMTSFKLLFFFLLYNTSK